MVLKDGGPCIALKKDKATGNMNMCGKMRDHLFYAGPICKGCYESASRKKQKESGVATGIAVDLEDLQEESQEKLVEIEEIYGSRCVRARTRDPQPERETHSPTPHSQVSSPSSPTRSLVLTFASAPPVARGHRFSKIPRDRRERRDALEEDEKLLEYDVYGKFEFERDNGKKSKAEWGRRWCPVSECAEVEDWVDSVKAYEIELKGLCVEAEETYGETSAAGAANAVGAVGAAAAAT